MIGVVATFLFRMGSVLVAKEAVLPLSAISFSPVGGPDLVANVISSLELDSLVDLLLA